MQPSVAGTWGESAKSDREKLEPEGTPAATVVSSAPNFAALQILRSNDDADAETDQTEGGGDADEADDAPPDGAPTESDIRVEKAFDALLADWNRQEQSLEQGQFDRVVLKRKLDAEEIVAVLRRLRTAGVDLQDLDEDESGAGAVDEAKVDNRSPVAAQDFVKGFSKASLLPHDEHIRLTRAVQIGLLAQREIEAGFETPDLKVLVADGDRARSKMVVANVRLVFGLARKLGRVGSLEFTDHVQNGVIGLMRAVEMFDPDLGLKFSTYATWWIRQSIWRGNDNEGEMIRVPVHAIEKLRRLRRMAHRLSVETGRDPTVTDLAEALEWPREQVAFIQRLSMFGTTSLDVPIDDAGEISLKDILPSSEPSPEQVTTILSRDRLLNTLLATLSPRERMILDRRFGLTSRIDETLQEIGDDEGVTRERIRQIEDKALKKLYKRALRHVKALED